MDIISKALKVMEQGFKAGEKLNSSAKTKDYLRLQLGNEKEEVLSALFLNNNHELIAFEKIFRGTINESSIKIRPILRMAIEHNAAKIILAHNHPSGNETPSDADIMATKAINKILKEVDCPVIDHIIVTKTQSVSMAELGLI